LQQGFSELIFHNPLTPATSLPLLLAADTEQELSRRNIQQLTPNSSVEREFTRLHILAGVFLQPDTTTSACTTRGVHHHHSHTCAVTSALNAVVLKARAGAGLFPILYLFLVIFVSVVLSCKIAGIASSYLPILLLHDHGHLQCADRISGCGRGLQGRMIFSFNLPDIEKS